MSINDYCTLTELAKLLVNETRCTVGKALKDVKLRTPTRKGQPTPLAHSLGLVRKIEGPKPWVEVWLWHREKTIPWLEKAGMQRKEVEQTV